MEGSRVLRRPILDIKASRCYNYGWQDAEGQPATIAAAGRSLCPSKKIMCNLMHVLVKENQERQHGARKSLSLWNKQSDL
jgi:hypothetical protein